VIANLGLILTNRNWSSTIISGLRVRNVALRWIALSAIAFLGLAIYVPFLRDLFHFGVLYLNDILICIAAGVTSILWFEGVRYFIHWTRPADPC
jgi:Ca2+-transporting ATPase